MFYFARAQARQLVADKIVFEGLSAEESAEVAEIFFHGCWHRASEPEFQAEVQAMSKRLGVSQEKLARIASAAMANRVRSQAKKSPTKSAQKGGARETPPPSFKRSNSVYDLLMPDAPFFCCHKYSSPDLSVQSGRTHQDAVDETTAASHVNLPGLADAGVDDMLSGVFSTPQPEITSTCNEVPRTYGAPSRNVSAQDLMLTGELAGLGLFQEAEKEDRGEPRPLDSFSEKYRAVRDWARAGAAPFAAHFGFDRDSPNFATGLHHGMPSLSNVLIAEELKGQGYFSDLLPTDAIARAVAAISLGGSNDRSRVAPRHDGFGYTAERVASELEALLEAEEILHGREFTRNGHDFERQQQLGQYQSKPISNMSFDAMLEQELLGLGLGQRSIADFKTVS